VGHAHPSMKARRTSSGLSRFFSGIAVISG
jgi:hypothetical protein